MVVATVRSPVRPGSRGPTVGSDTLAQIVFSRPRGGFGVRDDEDPELSFSIIRRVDGGDFPSKSSDGDGGPAGELNSGPAFELEAHMAAGGDERNIVSTHPQLDGAIGGVGTSTNRGSPSLTTCPPWNTINLRMKPSREAVIVCAS